MKRKHNSIDGFIPRRPHRVDLDQANKQNESSVGHMRQYHDETTEVENNNHHQKLHLKSAADDEYTKDDIESTLNTIKSETEDQPVVARKRRKIHYWKIIFKIIKIAIVVAFIALVIFVGQKLWHLSSHVLSGGIFGLFNQKELRQDQYGRSNVLILGATDDTPGRDGATLTDSMMVVSVNQKNKDVTMFSVPRDLYVNYGRDCPSGNRGKINAYYACNGSGDDKASDDERMKAISQLVGKIFGIEIHYTAHINTVVIRDLVNAVGGVDVDIQSEDPRGVFDSSFDWVCNNAKDYAERKKICPTGHYIDFPNGSTHMDGQKAQLFSQARGYLGGNSSYGLSQSNFDREKNQQLVLLALKDKAISTGVIYNVGEVLKIMDSLGSNLRTNVDSSEIQSILKLGAEINDGQIKRLSFVDPDNMLMTTGNIEGQSVVYPAAGLYQYQKIQAYLKKELFGDPTIQQEAAKVVVLNASGEAGVAQVEADKLAALGMKIVAVGNAESADYKNYQIYHQSSDQKQATEAKLSELYGADIINDKSSENVAEDADYVVIIGQK